MFSLAFCDIASSNDVWSDSVPHRASERVFGRVYHVVAAAAADRWNERASERARQRGHRANKCGEQDTQFIAFLKWHKN